MYRIVNWDQEYEVNEKGNDWKPGQTKRAGPLTFIRSQVRGKNVSPGFRRLRRHSGGDEKALRNFGLFQKLLELAGDARREDRNRLPDAEEIAFLLDVSLDVVQEGLTHLTQAGWIEEIPVNSRNSRNFPEFPANQPTNEPTNQPTNKPPTSSLDRWSSVVRAVVRAFGEDRGHHRLLDHIANSLTAAPSARIEEVCDQIESLLEDSQSKDNPAGWFQAAASKQFGHRNGEAKHGKRR